MEMTERRFFSIHTLKHKNKNSTIRISPHYHIWTNGSQSSEAYPLTTEMKQLLMYIRNYGHTKQQKK